MSDEVLNGLEDVIGMVPKLCGAYPEDMIVMLLKHADDTLCRHFEFPMPHNETDLSRVANSLIGMGIAARAQSHPVMLGFYSDDNLMIGAMMQMFGMLGIPVTTAFRVHSNRLWDLAEDDIESDGHSYVATNFFDDDEPLPPLTGDIRAGIEGDILNSFLRAVDKRVDWVKDTGSDCPEGIYDEAVWLTARCADHTPFTEEEAARLLCDFNNDKLLMVATLATDHSVEAAEQWTEASYITKDSSPGVLFMAALTNWRAGRELILKIYLEKIFRTDPTNAAANELLAMLAQGVDPAAQDPTRLPSLLQALKPKARHL